MPPTEYALVPSGPDEAADAGPKRESDHFRHGQQPVRWDKRTPWIISNIVWLGISAVLSWQLWFRVDPAPDARGTYETAFATDIRALYAIPLEIRQFTGTRRFESNGTSWRTLDSNADWPENVSYSGPPSQLIDDAWDALIGCRYVSLSEDEAKSAWGANFENYRDRGLGGFTAGLDVFHTLHCVNALRKALYPDYYPPERLHDRAHLEHCIDVLRQEVQCYGSTTLIPTRYFESIEQNYIDSDQKHVCRSFTALRRWTDRRRKGGDLYIQRDHSDIDEVTHQRAVDNNLDQHGNLCS